MSDSNWGNRDKAVAGLFFLISGLLLASAIYWTGLLSGYHEGRRIEASARHEAEAKHQVEQACVALTGASLVECIYDTAAAAQESKRSEQDLDAQQGMERWAFLMFAAAVAQTFVAGAALIFLMKDLRQNRYSAETQLRAYVQAGQWLEERGAFPLDGTPNVAIQVVNKGQTPAVNLSVTGVFSTFPANATQEEIEAKMKDKGHVAALGMDVPLILQSKNSGQLSVEDRLAFARGEVKFVLCCRLEYDDSFGRHHVTQFKAETEQPDVPELSMSRDGNWMT